MVSKVVISAFLALGLAATAWAQTYDELMEAAQRKVTAGEYEDALDLFEQALEIREGDYTDYYNAACIASLADKPDLAFTYLDKAVENGLMEKQMLETDSDLENLRSDDRWAALLVALNEKIQAATATLPETHAEGTVVNLPEPKFEGAVSVEEALKNRRSIRAYADVPLTLEEVSQLLWSAYGLTKAIEGGPAFLRGGLRTAPSAGALYPLEVYLVARNVSGLPKGVYWYESEKHQLVQISDEDRWEDLSDAGFNQPHFRTASAAIVYSAVFERNTSKYGERGRDRYVCMDLGHSAENVYLQAYALKIGTCAIGAFADVALKTAIGMTKAEEPLYIMPLGKLE